MKRKGFQNSAAGCGLVFSIGLVVSTAAQQPPSNQQPAWNNDLNRRVFVELPPPDPYDWTRHFRVGVLVGLNLSAHFSVSGNSSVSGGGAPGVYDDGYVHPISENTQDDYTSDWGYNNASQLVGTTLLMTQTTGFTPVSGGSATQDSPGQIGFDLAYGGTIRDWGRTRMGWEFGFGFLPVSISDNQVLQGQISQNVFAFDIGNISTEGLPPGYLGSPNGGPSIHILPCNNPANGPFQEL